MSGKTRNPERRCKICGGKCNKRMRYCKLCAREVKEIRERREGNVFEGNVFGKIAQQADLFEDAK